MVRQALLVIFFTAVMVALGIALYSTRWIVLSVLIGIGAGVLISPVINHMKLKLRIPYALGAFFMFLLLVAATGGILYVAVLVIVEQIEPLSRALPQILDGARQAVLRVLSNSPWLQRQFQSFGWGGAVQNTLQALLAGVQVGAAAIGGFFFVLGVALFLAVSPEQYLAGFLSLFPARHRAKTKHVLLESAVSLRRWFFSQLVAMASVGTLAAIGLKLLGIEYWLFFGLLTAVLDLVPYIGPLLAAAGTVVVTLGSDPGKVPWVIVMYLVVQNIEADLVIPLVMRGRIKLPPVHLMTLMLMLGSWFGVLGVFVAPPLLAVGRTIYLLTYVPRMNRAL
jgi:predicted PurR-regulated permease PerM